MPPGPPPEVSRSIKNPIVTRLTVPVTSGLLGIFWQGQYYYDRAMPMGCASSCRTFEMFSTAIEWVAKKHGML
jgi:hypothetical protein